MFTNTQKITSPQWLGFTQATAHPNPTIPTHDPRGEPSCSRPRSPSDASPQSRSDPLGSPGAGTPGTSDEAGKMTTWLPVVGCCRMVNLQLLGGCIPTPEKD